MQREQQKPRQILRSELLLSPVYICNESFGLQCPNIAKPLTGMYRQASLGDKGSPPKTQDGPRVYRFQEGGGPSFC